MMDKYINGLRIIETARDFYKVDLNCLIDKGYNVLIKKVKSSHALNSTVYIFEHKETKHIDVVGYGRDYVLNEDSYERDYKLLEKIIYYPYKFEKPYAAYLIPSDIKINERVFVADLIEDYIGMKHWGNHRLQSCEALWNGKDLKILYDEYQMPDVVG